MAFGCTEIGLVALAAAEASKHFHGKIKKVEAYVSQFVYKNLARVGVPKMGQCGIYMIIAAGLVLQKSDKKLMLLTEITDEQIIKAQEIVDKKIIDVFVEKNVSPVYGKIIIYGDDNTQVEMLIEHKHDEIQYAKKNNVFIYKNENNNSNIDQEKEGLSSKDFTLQEVIKYVDSFTLDDLKFLEKTISTNNVLVEEATKKLHKLTLTKGYKTHLESLKNPKWLDLVLYDIFGAIEARMVGCPYPVATSCGSGDHGLTIMVIVGHYAKYHNIGLLETLRALAFAHLITWIIKKNIQDLSAFCGSVIAATTSATVAIAYMKHFNLRQINDLVNMQLCSFTGSLCDGAKTSCAFKIVAAFVASYTSLNLIGNNAYIADKDGFVSKDCFETIINIGEISKENLTNLNNSIVKQMTKLNTK